jgi:hypothetical protein
LKRKVSQKLALILILIIGTAVLQACQSEHDAAVPAPDPLPKGEEIVNRFREVEACHNAKLKVKARLTEEDGAEREFTIMTYEKCVDGTQYSLRQVVLPKEERGRAMLSLETPGQPVEAVAYLPGFQKFVQVGNLSQEDTLFGLSIQESLGGYDLYDYETVGKERLGEYEAYKVEGKLKPEASSRFNRTVTYYRQDHFLPLRVELYDSQNQLLRVRDYLNWTQIDGHWTAMHTDVNNLAHKKRIIFETVEVSFQEDLPLSFFSRETLKRLIESQR